MELKLPKNFPQALSSGVLVFPITEQEMKTAGGLIIPDVATGAQDEMRKPKVGIIAHVGPECKFTVTDVETGKPRLIRKGDKISHAPYADSGFMFDSNFYLQMSELDIKTYFPDDTAKMTTLEMPSRKRGAVEKKKNQYK